MVLAEGFNSIWLHVPNGMDVDDAMALVRSDARHKTEVSERCTHGDTDAARLNVGKVCWAFMAFSRRKLNGLAADSVVDLEAINDGDG